MAEEKKMVTITITESAADCLAHWSSMKALLYGPTFSEVIETLMMEWLCRERARYDGQELENYRDGISGEFERVKNLYPERLQ